MEFLVQIAQIIFFLCAGAGALRVAAKIVQRPKEFHSAYCQCQSCVRDNTNYYNELDRRRSVLKLDNYLPESWLVKEDEPQQPSLF